jgi:endogenous inhibitor of DNA gyrase (YacG/DUF329 family)
MKKESERKPNYLWAVFTNKCPRCRKGYIFKTKNGYDLKHTVDMVEKCPECGQPTEIEVGFYYGTGYVSYALSVAFLVASFIAWKVLIGMTFALDDNRMFYWMGTAIGLLLICQPLVMRLSRSFWLSWFVKYDKDWQAKKQENAERVIEEQMKNW